MPKTVSAAFALSKAKRATAFCGLLKVGPLRDSSFITVTSSTQDITYDDGTGDGPLVYRHSTGMELSNISASADLSVDNAEAKTLMPVYPAEGITPAMIDRGDLDAVEYVVYEVNYLDLSEGHEEMASGPIGEQRVQRGGLITIELRGWSQYLKQRSVVEFYSITCRATFGSMPIGTGGGVVEERKPCNYDITGEWVDFTVVDVGTETVRQLTISGIGLNATDAWYAPGSLEFYTGDNEGQQREVELYTPAGAGEFDVSLLMTTRNPIQAGDTGRIRRRCTLRWDGHNSCTTFNNKPWFRGEKDIPIGDSLALNVPGVAGGGMNTGTGEASPE